MAAHQLRPFHRGVVLLLVDGARVARIGAIAQKQATERAAAERVERLVPAARRYPITIELAQPHRDRLRVDSLGLAARPAAPVADDVALAPASHRCLHSCNPRD